MVRWSSLALPITVAVVTILIVLGAGIGTGYAIFEPKKSNAEGQVKEQMLQLTKLQDELAARDVRVEELLKEVAQDQEKLTKVELQLRTTMADLEASRQIQTDLSEAQEIVTQRDTTVAELQRKIESFSPFEDRIGLLEKSLAPLESDRFLLVELRKDMPETREAATDYWEDLKSLAIKSDPSLSPKADRVLNLLPAYFDWLEAEYVSSCEFFDAFVSSGAVGFSTVASDFDKDVFLVLINRMDALVSQLD